MTTSLAAQLKRLAVPDVQISLGSDFKQASFLYDDSEAAKYDRDHFYNIGVNGLQQLIAKDERFSEFEDSLYSPSSRSIQRTVQTTEVNKQLDASINKFLLRVSPYMQLREAHKAIEWLVNRFNVHLRNVDAFMMCVLPFHDQEPFIMALRLLKMNTKECATWKWLESIKNADTFLPKQTLITHCRSFNGFLGLMCTMLSRHIEENTDENGQPAAKCLAKVISFFTQIAIGVILEGTPSEQIISVLIPTLSAGLKATDLKDYIMSSYMILSHLLVSCDLARPLLKSLLNVLCKNLISDMLPSALNVVALMFQKQNISKVSKKALRYLIRHPLFPKAMIGLSREVKLEPFTTPFLAALTHKVLKNPVEVVTSDTNIEDEDITAQPPISVLSSILESVSLENKSVVTVIRLLVTWFVSNAESDTNMEVDDEYAMDDGPFRLFRLLDKKFPDLLAATLVKLSQTDDSGLTEKVVNDLKLKSVTVAHHNLISDPETSLVVCLHHHDVSVRKKAVDQMLLDGEKILGKEGLQSSLLLRLEDQNAEVVDAILQSPEKVWELFEDKKLLLETLMKKLCSLKHQPLSETHRQILTAICCYLPDDENLTAEVTTVVLSFLVPVDKDLKSFSLQEELLASAFSKKNSSLLPSVSKVFSKDRKSSAGEDCVNFVQKLVDHLTAHFMKAASVEELQKLFDCILKGPRPGCASLLLIMVNVGLIQKARNEKVKLAFQKQLVSMLVDLTAVKDLLSFKKPQSQGTSLDTQTIICCTLKSLSACDQLPIEMVAFCQQELKLGSASHALKKMKFWQISSLRSVESEWLWVMMTFFNFLLELTTHKQSELSAFLQQIFQNFFKVLGNNDSVVKLLCMIWSNDEVTPVHKAMALQFAQSYLTSLPDSAMEKLVADETTPVLPFVLVLMTSPSRAVRKVAFNIMDAMSSKKDNSKHLFNWFSAHFLQYRQEVEIDMAFAGQVMKNFLEGSDDVDPPSPKKRRKSSSKPSTPSLVLDFLVNVAVDPLTPVIFQRGILEILQNLDSVECFHPFMGLLHSLITSSNQGRPQALPVVKRDLMRLLINRLTPTVAIGLEQGSQSLQTTCLALECETMLEAPGETAQLLAVRQLSRKFMSALPNAGQKSLFSKILNIMTTSPYPEMVRRCRKVVKHMKLDSSLVILEMQTVLLNRQATTVREAKRQKIQSSSESTDMSDLLSVQWKRIILLFEMIQSKKKMFNAGLLVPAAFQILARVLDIETEGSGEYAKQLILSAICKICSMSVEKADSESNEAVVTGEHLNMELIIQCIRSSTNSHTHHQALLLLSIAAKIAPGLLLHNMMSVFIFMGVNVLRQDNEYSFHVIGRILENVIPAIITACEQTPKGDKPTPKKKKSSDSVKSTDAFATKKSESVITVVLRVFVDAIPHIPSHRKIVLFKKLMSVVGIEQYLWRLMLLYIESVIKRPKSSEGDFLPQEKTSGPVSTSDIEFLSSLSEEFSSIQLFKCVDSILNYISQLPEELKRDGYEKVQEGKKAPITLDNISREDSEIFNTRNHTPKQLRHFKYAAVFALTELLSSEHLVAELSVTDQSAFLPCYQNVLETVLKLISQVASSNDSHKDDMSARFWKILLNKCHDLMENLVTLLPDSMFMQVVSGLMNHSLTLVQKRALDLLGSKLQRYKDSSLNQEQKKMLLSMVDKLEKIIQRCLLPKGKTIPKDEEVVNGQTAIYSLKVLCRILGEANYGAFLGVLKPCMETLRRYSDNGMVSASAMLCIAEVISCAKVHAIEYLAQLMPLLISEIQLEEITRHEVLLLASITSLQKIIEALPLFLSPYLPDIISQISIIRSSLHSGSHKPVIFQKIKLICSTLATVTATRKFLPALERSVSDLQDKLVSCAECLMTMLKEHIESMSREDLTTFSQDLLKFFFNCFNLRIDRTEIDGSDMTTIEGFVIDAFISLVFKLSEAQFKPMLFELFTWATEEDASKERLLIFYKLCHRLAEKLKNLFTLFAGHILKHSAVLLDENNRSKTKSNFFGKGKIARAKSCCLLQDILGCLQKTFAHDTEGFLNKERFDVVMQPIVDQIENQVGKSSVAEERVEQHLVPCIASLAAAAHDDLLWKEMNYQILLKTRNQSSQVRMWALSVVDAFHKQLGEDYTQLVPETIPFIAELMEDESERVEALTQKVIASMEVSVGENLQEYF